MTKTDFKHINLRLFDNTNTTGDAGLSGEMKTYYSDYLIDLVQPMLVHDQFAQKHPIPQGKGKSIEFRKYDSLPKALTPLTEGVTPTGQKLNMSTITATVSQYGGYVELSDILLLTAIDNNQVEAVKLLARQAGLTLDTITREVLAGGTNVQYHEGLDSSLTSRHQLVGGETTGNHYLTVRAIRTAVRTLKVQNAAKINGDYVGIVHPDSADILMEDNDWKYPHTYVDPEQIYSNELGRLYGVRFVESTEAKIFHADDLVPKDGDTAGARTVTVASYASKVVTIDEALTTAQAAALKDRYVIIDGEKSKIASATAGSAGAATITLAEAPTETPVDGDVVYPGEAGAKGRDVYATIVLGDNAYGTTEVTGGGLTYISKPLGSGGTTDPLDMRATCGWKATKVAERLVEQYMVRIEHTTKFEAGAN